MNFQVGDVVVLKSGGLDMTVADVQDDRTFCIWFNQQGGAFEEQRGNYPPETLQKRERVATL